MIHYRFEQIVSIATYYYLTIESFSTIENRFLSNLQIFFKVLTLKVAKQHNSFVENLRHKYDSNFRMTRTIFYHKQWLIS